MLEHTTYIMDDRREAHRLASKVDPSQWIDCHVADHASEATRSVLDVGCGPGVMVVEMARRWPCAGIVGIDASADRIELARESARGLPNAVFVQASATRLPFDSESFDLVHCRFLLEYLSDRHAAIAECVRVCRSGGKVILCDLDGQLVWHDPPDCILQDQINRVVEGLARTGFDPFVGRKLFRMARLAGLSEVSVHIEPYHLIAGSATMEQMRQWSLKLDIAQPMIERVLGSKSQAEDLKRRFMEYLQRDDTLTYSVLFRVIGTKSPAGGTENGPE